MKFLFIILLFFSTVSKAQIFEISGIPLCWNTGSVDSSVTAYRLIASNFIIAVNLTYLNANGESVTGPGSSGTLTYGYCNCANPSISFTPIPPAYEMDELLAILGTSRRKSKNRKNKKKWK